MSQRIGPSEVRIPLDPDYSSVETKRPSVRNEASSLQSQPSRSRSCGCIDSLIDAVKSFLRRIFPFFFSRPQRQEEPDQILLDDELEIPEIPIEPREEKRRVEPELPAAPSSSLPQPLPKPIQKPIADPLPGLPNQQSALANPSSSLPQPPLQPIVNPFPDLPNLYSDSKEKSALDEASKRGASSKELLDLKEVFVNGRKRYDFLCALYANFRASHQNPQLYLSNNSSRPADIVFEHIVNHLKMSYSQLPELFDEMLRIKPLADVILSHRGKSGDTILHWAALAGHDDIVQQLLDHKADPTVKTSTPLHLASFYKGEIVPIDLEAGKTYQESARIFHERRITFMLSQKPSTSIYESKFNDVLTCFFSRSAPSRKVPLIDAKFIGSISDVNQHLANGDTFLHAALGLRNVPLVLALLEKGADPLIPSATGQSALDEAISRLRVIISTDHAPTSHYMKQSACIEQIAALFLDAAETRYPQNLEEYKKIRSELLEGNTFFHLVTFRGPSDDLLSELEICSRVGYNPFTSAFERSNPWKLNNRGRSVFDYMKTAIEKSERFMVNNFILPLYRNRVISQERAAFYLKDTPFASMPSDVVGIVSSYMVVDEAAEQRRTLKEAQAREFEIFFGNEESKEN